MTRMTTRRSTRRSIQPQRVMIEDERDELRQTYKADLNRINSDRATTTSSTASSFSTVTGPSRISRISMTTRANTTTNVDNRSVTPERDVSQFISDDYFDRSPKTDYTYGDSGSYRKRMLGRSWISPNMSRSGIRKNAAGYISMREEYGSDSESESLSAVDNRLDETTGCQLANRLASARMRDRDDRGSTSSSVNDSDRILRSECHRSGGGLCGNTDCRHKEHHRQYVHSHGEHEKMDEIITTTTRTVTTEEKQRRGALSSEEEADESGIEVEDVISRQSNNANLIRRREKRVRMSMSGAGPDAASAAPVWRSFLSSVRSGLSATVGATSSSAGGAEESNYNIRNWGLDNSEEVEKSTSSEQHKFSSHSHPSSAAATDTGLGAFSSASEIDEDEATIEAEASTNRRRRRRETTHLTTEITRRSSGRKNCWQWFINIVLFIPRLLLGILSWLLFCVEDHLLTTRYRVREYGFITWITSLPSSLKTSTGSPSYKLLPFYLIYSILTLPVTMASTVIRGASAISSGESFASAFYHRQCRLLSAHEHNHRTILTSTLRKETVASQIPASTTLRRRKSQEEVADSRSETDIPLCCCCLPLILLLALILAPLFYPALIYRARNFSLTHHWQNLRESGPNPPFSTPQTDGKRTSQRNEMSASEQFWEFLWPTKVNDGIQLTINDGKCGCGASAGNTGVVLDEGQKIVDQKYLASFFADLKERLDEHERRLNIVDANLTETHIDIMNLKTSISEASGSIRTMADRMSGTEQKLTDLLLLTQRITALERLVQDQKEAFATQVTLIEAKWVKMTSDQSDHISTTTGEMSKQAASLHDLYSRLSTLEAGEAKLREAQEALALKMKEKSTSRQLNDMSKTWEEKHDALSAKLSAAIEAAVFKAGEAMRLASTASSSRTVSTPDTDKSVSNVAKTEGWNEEEQAKLTKEVTAMAQEAAKRAARDELAFQLSKEGTVSEHLATWQSHLESSILALVDNRSYITAASVAREMVANQSSAETSLFETRLADIVKNTVKIEVSAHEQHITHREQSQVAPSSSEYPGDERVRFLIGQALDLFAADRLARPDFALESAGGSVVGTRCTQTYNDAPALFSLFGVPLLKLSRSPRTLIEANSQPGECWAYRGQVGQVVIQLASRISITGVTLEHIPRSLAPNQRIDSAPKDFLIKGLADEGDIKGVILGNFTYTDIGPALQTFEILEPMAFNFVELSILSNHGNREYTCVYRLRVHGIPAS